MSNLPRKAVLRDGAEVTIRQLGRDDEKALVRFFQRLPEKERINLHEDVSDPAVAKRWCQDRDPSAVLALVALKQKRICALASLHKPRHGWSRHVGGIRVAVDASVRRKGAASLLVWELVRHALDREVEIITAEMTRKHEFLMSFLETLGFRKEAEIDGFVADQKGGRHPLIIMAVDTIGMWKKLKDFLHDRSFAGF